MNLKSTFCSFLILFLFGCGHYYCKYEHFNVEDEFSINIETVEKVYDFRILNDRYIFSALAIDTHSLIEFYEDDLVIKNAGERIIHVTDSNGANYTIENYNFDQMTKFMNQCSR